MADETEARLGWTADPLRLKRPVVDPGRGPDRLKAFIRLFRPSGAPDIHVPLGLGGVERRLVLRQAGAVEPLARLGNRTGHILALVPVALLGGGKPGHGGRVQPPKRQQAVGMGLLGPVPEAMGS